MNRSGNQSNIIRPSNVQRQKHVQHWSLIKILHYTSARLINITIYNFFIFFLCFDTVHLSIILVINQLDAQN